MAVHEYSYINPSTNQMLGESTAISLVNFNYWNSHNSGELDTGV